jgi:hypothetical protein
MNLYDPHQHAEPFLVLTGLTFLIPAYYAMLQEHVYLMCSYVLLCSTTILFHSTRHPIFFCIDAVAIMNHIIGGAFIVYHQSNRERAAIIFTTTYSFITYFVGQQYKIFSFDPDWNIKMFFHGLMHVFSAYAACLSLDYNLRITNI